MLTVIATSTSFFDFSFLKLEFLVLRIIYTTNTVEGYHRQIRKVTKNKGVFPSDTALEKLVYLAYRNIRKKWTMPLANCYNLTATGHKVWRTI